MSTITIRLVKSFEYRNVKSLILKGLDLDALYMTDLVLLIQTELNQRTGYEPFRNVSYDTLKLYVQAHGTKSQHLVINFSEEDGLVILSPTCKKTGTLASLNIKNETELSYFNWADYEKYKKDPKILW